MSSQLHAYKYINTKLRARIGDMFDDSFFHSLVAAASVDDAVTVLGDNGYGDVARAYRETGDVRMCEHELYRREIGILTEVEGYLEETRREFVALLGDRYEIENLKTALRLWFEGVIRGRQVESKIMYLSRHKVHRDIHLDRIVNAASPDEIPRTLTGTPYEEPISKTLDSVATTSSIFSMERALDNDYITRLRKSAAALPPPDRNEAVAFITLEIDRENVSWIARSAGYYDLSEEDIAAGLLPGGAVFDEDTLQRAIRSGRTTGPLLERIGRTVEGSGRDGGGRHGRDLALIEAALAEQQDHLVHRFLGSYPFTMGVVLSYYLLAQKQLHRISTVLNGLAYGLPVDAVEALL